MSDKNLNENSGVLKGEESLLLDHNYDGIQELDHVLPRWWLWTLYGTIVFAIGYCGYYLTGIGPNPQQELSVALKEIEALSPAPSSGGGSASSEGELLAASKDASRVKHGAEVYAGKCLACHGDKGQGIVGPNLTDDFWIHGKGTLSDMANLIAIGVPEKGMPPWGTLLTTDELKDVVAFVHSLHGSNPPGAKAPQGEKQESKN